MFYAVVGHSDDPDSPTAVAEVLEHCLKALSGRQPQAGVLFAAIDFDHALILQKINQAFPELLLIGGTSDGEISSVLGFQQDSVTLMLFCSDEVEFSVAVGRNVSKNPIAIAQRAIETAAARLTASPCLCVTCPESLTTSGMLILEGLKQGLGKEVPVVGGTTGDQWKFQETHQFFGTEVLSDAVPILLMAGNLRVGYGVQSGWTPMGKKGIVTKAQSNTLYEIDGQPALNFYRNYAGETRPSPEHRLAVFEANRDSWYMRTSSGKYDEESGSICFFADMPEQAQIQVVCATRDKIIDSAAVSMQTALENYPGDEPVAVLFFSCTGRIYVLGTQTQMEYERARALTSAPLTYCGFYTYGEIAPLYPGGETQFHNETFVTVVLGTR